MPVPVVELPLMFSEGWVVKSRGCGHVRIRKEENVEEREEGIREVGEKRGRGL